MTPSAAAVAAASEAWVWIPDVAITVEADEYLLVRYPDWYDEPLVLTRVRPRRPTAQVLDEALARAAELGPPEVVCWVRPDSVADLEPLLAARGTLAETVDVLARGLGAEPPAPAAPGVELRWVADLATLRDFEAVGVEVFGGALPPPGHLEQEAARAALAFATGAAARLVAYVDGGPVAAAGVSLVDGVARLWGGAVLERHRGRGIYRTLLDHRLAWSAEGGAELALVKGRAATSGPILRRAGFTAYGQERGYRLRLPNHQG
ncbi:GNAT family N-acetyltransferase [Nocardioides sp. T2.26MG-1]|uniref:GNAT family N-acetyltransferase n=1 Tax=Nocardioides sp. T2.26MG-1 TaxID=3041166 RepID=UPI0024778333|nr:GNAT family N-acetyltransferase [Nocardioides sp. T2.26MG-1]CAI9419402.1 hypothetical protein HIDPHFAB_03674 [Nocardioides sp. T2.26MG-1]